VSAAALLLRSGVGPPAILKADVSSGNVFITGSNLGTGKSPLVTLGNVTLSIESYAPTSIVALLPSALSEGSYALLVVSYGPDGYMLQPATFVLTVGAVGPPGPTGAPGAPGAQGPVGLAGQSVVGSSEPPGPNCASGGSAFASASGTVYACNGAPGATGGLGSTGPQGIAGQSVVGSSEPPGPNCGYGGSAFASSAGVTYACNGAPGSWGQSVTAVGLDAGDPNCPTGGSAFVAANGTIYACNGDPGLAGSQGVPGSQGAMGAQGPTGPQGPPGVAGATGPQGPAGAQGPPGVQGVMGTVGPQGPAGVSVSGQSLAAGDPNCPNGGSAFQTASGVTYACNGTPPGGTDAGFTTGAFYATSYEIRNGGLGELVPGSQSLFNNVVLLYNSSPNLTIINSAASTTIDAGLAFGNQSVPLGYNIYENTNGVLEINWTDPYFLITGSSTECNFDYGHVDSSNDFSCVGSIGASSMAASNLFMSGTGGDQNFVLANTGSGLNGYYCPSSSCGVYAEPFLEITPNPVTSRIASVNFPASTDPSNPIVYSMNGFAVPQTLHGHGTALGGILAVNFSTIFTAVPDCTCTDNTAANVCYVSLAPTTAGVTFSSGSGSDVISWICEN
jgi:hypothetical protein